VSQQRRRRPVASTSTGIARRQTRSNRTQRIYAIVGIVVVVALIGTIVGPPLVDYLTQPNDDSEIIVDDQTPDPVEDELRADVATNPDDPVAMAALANYLGNTGRIDEAIEWYERALALAPEDWVTRLGFARVLSNGGKRPDAELQFQRVIAACPLDEQARFSLGQLYANWIPPRAAEAAEQYWTVIAVAPETFVAERAREELSRLGVASPGPETPAIILPASPTSAEGCL
jgi:tetratricopeptide (TPR) repeat protein